MARPNCYACVHRGTVPGDAHSCCRHPETGCSGDLFDGIQAMLDGRVLKAAKKLGIKADAHGVRSGWFMWPANFDPVWLESCSGYEPKKGGG